MKFLFENWRGFVNEEAEIIDFPAISSSDKTFNLDLNKLNASIKRITDVAKEVLGAEGEAPYFTAEDFQETSRMVAEQEEVTYSDEPLTDEEIQKARAFGVQDYYTKTIDKKTKKIPYKPSEIRRFIARVEAAELPTGSRALPTKMPSTSRAELRKKFFARFADDFPSMTAAQIEARAKEIVASSAGTTKKDEVQKLTAELIAAQRAAIEKLPVGSIQRARAMRKLRGMSGGVQSVKRDPSIPVSRIGKMKPEDFEKEGIVIPVPDYVIISFREMIAEIKETGKLYEQAKQWYHSIRGLIDNATETDRDGALLGLMIATYSPRAKFALNLAEAIVAYKAIQEDAKENPDLLRDFVHSFPKKIETGPRKGKAFSQFDDMKGVRRGWTSAHKVPNFALNLIAPNLALDKRTENSISLKDMYEWNSTIDTWMIDAFYPTLRAASTAKEWSAIKGDIMSNVVSYRYLSSIVAREAKNLGILPQELQAIIWVASQRNLQGELNSGTVEQAFDAIKQSIRSLTEIQEGLAELIGYEEDDWMGNIVRTIEKSGFEAAGRYLTEPDVGIRSLTSKGAKGDLYPYLQPVSDDEITKKNKGKKSSLNEEEEEEEEEEKKVYDPKKYETWWLHPKYENLKLYWVMKNVIQMNTGKFSNLHDSVLLYLEDDFNTKKAIDYILGRFSDEDFGSSDYFQKDIAGTTVRDISGKEREINELKRKLKVLVKELRAM